MCKARTVRYIGLAVRVYERNETVALAVDCQQGEDERKKKREREGGGKRKDSILYFFRTRFPVTSNLDYTAPRATAFRAVVAGDRNFILFAVRPARLARSLAYVSCVRSLALSSRGSFP